MKRNAEQIKQLMKERGLYCQNRKEISEWALIFAIEDLVEKISRE